MKQATAEMHPETPNAEYQLAIALESSHWMDRQFVGKRESSLPAVCIEGIRVSDDLPWFGSPGSMGRGRNALGCLLSVSGDRRFRTTVSRSGLERDKEYHRVGKICASLLFEHVRDETARVSQGEGQPLSQASVCSTSAARAPCTRN